MQCDICGAKPSKTHVNYDQHTKHGFEVVEFECGFGVTQLPSNIDLTDYYPKEYFGKRSKRFLGPIENLISWFRKKRVNLALKSKPLKQGKILDIGCGRGFFLHEFQNLGWEVSGTEFSEDSCENAKEILGDKVYVERSLQSLPFEEESFDLVTMWHVLEHLENYQDAVGAIKKIIKKDGVVLVEVPNFDSLQAHLARSRWLYLEAPRHLLHFNLGALKELFEKEGFKMSYLGTFSWEFGPFGMLQSLLNCLPIEPNFLYALLKKRGAESLKISKVYYLYSVLMTALFTPLFSPLAFILEAVASMVGRGSCLRIELRRK